MSCGCGCRKQNHGNMLTGSYGLPNPSIDGYSMIPVITHMRNQGYGGGAPPASFSPLSLLANMGLGGLGDNTTDSIDLSTLPVGTGDSIYNPLVTYTPPSPTISTTNPAATPNPITNLLASLAGSWSATSQQILKAQAGALPTYQTVNPQTGQSTTIYGNAAGLNLPSSLTNIFGTGSELPLLLGVGLLLMMMMGRK